jgi:fatty-acid desaturase
VLFWTSGIVAIDAGGPVQLGNVFYYVREARNTATLEKYAHDISVDRWDRSFFNHGLVGPVVGTVAAGLHGMIYVFFLSSSINGLCHVRGSRTFDNTATNIPWLALLTGGEGFHNTITVSRAAPSSASARARLIRAGRSFSCSPV